MKRRHPIAAELWATTETALPVILELLESGNDPPEALAARFGIELDRTFVTEERNGVAVIPVVGPIFRYPNFLTFMGWASSYEILAKDFTTALENPDIHSIVLDIDSPGGEVNGCAELAAMMFEARGTKPIVAYASGDAASGAYWLASAADEVVVSETSSLGSIGVVALFRGKNKRESAPLEIVSSQSPNKRLDPETDQGRLRLQQRIDALAEVFVESVARHRGVDPPHVLEHYGGGDVFVGQHAVTAGLADRTGSLEKVITQLIDNHSPDPATSRGFLFSREHQQETTMDLETLQAEHPDLVNTLTGQGFEQGRTQERERVGAIISSDEAKGRESLAQHLAFSTELSVETALATLKAAPVQTPTAVTSVAQQTGFEQLMQALGNPAVDPDPDEPNESETVEAVAKRIAGFAKGGVV